MLVYQILKLVPAREYADTLKPVATDREGYQRVKPHEIYVRPS
jgi:hypothetical protein